MTITANPYGWAYGNQIAARRFQPFVKFESVASHVGMRRASHLSVTGSVSRRVLSRAVPREVCMPSSTTIMIQREDAPRVAFWSPCKGPTTCNTQISSRRFELQEEEINECIFAWALGVPAVPIIVCFLLDHLLDHPVIATFFSSCGNPGERKLLSKRARP